MQSMQTEAAGAFSLLPHLIGCFIASGIVLFSCQENVFGVHLSLHRVIYTNLSDMELNFFRILKVELRVNVLQ